MRAALILPPLWLTAGCNVGPDYTRPSVEPWLGETFAYASSETNTAEPGTEAWPIDPWWRRFDDPLTDELVDEALAHNLDLGVASANVLESRALLRSAAGRRWPAISAGGAADRSFVTGEGRNRIYSTTVQASVNVSWQADLFGQLRRQVESAAANLGASESDYVALAHTVVSEVVSRRVDISVARRRLKLAEEIFRSRSDTLELIERRYRTGDESVSAVDVRLARENLAAARSELPARRRELELQGLALDVLLGRVPGASPIDPALLMEVPPVSVPPVGVPAMLLDRRPDLRASEFRIASASAGIGVAVADLYPDLTLTGTLGFSDDEFGDLFDLDALFGSIAGDLAFRVFEGGRLRAEVDAAKARYAAQATAYAGDLLGAIREVNDALVNEHRLREQIERVVEQVDAAQKAEDLARDRYNRGLESLLVVLDTERRRRNAEDQLIQLRGQLWDARIDLHLALGGDWGVEWRELNLSGQPEKSAEK